MPVPFSFSMPEPLIVSDPDSTDRTAFQSSVPLLPTTIPPNTVSTPSS